MNDEFSDSGSIGLSTRPRRAQVSWLASLALSMAPALALSIGCSDSAPRATDDEIRVFELTIEKRSVAVAHNVIRVLQGQRVELRWLTDESASIHLHGYDIQASLKPGTAVVWSFDADTTGRFPIEVHGFGDAEEPAQLHDHSDHHDHPSQEPASAAGTVGKTLLYFEVHPH